MRWVHCQCGLVQVTFPPAASPVAIEGPLESQEPPRKRRKLPWQHTAGQGSSTVAEFRSEFNEMTTGAHGAEIKASGNEIVPAGAGAISEGCNISPDAHSEEKSAAADVPSEVCKSATDAQLEAKSAVAGLSFEVNSVSAASPHDSVEHGVGVSVDPGALLIPVDLGAVAPPPAPRVGADQPIGPLPKTPPTGCIRCVRSRPTF